MTDRWDEFKKKMEAQGITEYHRVVPRLKPVPKLEYKDHKYKEEMFD